MNSKKRRTVGVRLKEKKIKASEENPNQEKR